ncbi:MAG: hypothetical protein IMZ64_09365 [Bacteroidetes bacterium]|nr:hypothetical protein [Bacteroidota bacterium]
MPREKTYQKLIPKIYRRKFEDIAMLFYVDGQRDIVPAISVEKALYNYFKHIGEEDFNIETSLTTYSRLKKELIDNDRNDTTLSEKDNNK